MASPGCSISLSMVTTAKTGTPAKKPYVNGTYLFLIFPFRLRTDLPKTSCGGECRANGRSRAESEGPGMKGASLSKGKAGITGENELSGIIMLSVIGLMCKVGRMGQESS